MSALENYSTLHKRTQFLPVPVVVCDQLVRQVPLLDLVLWFRTHGPFVVH